MFGPPTLIPTNANVLPLIWKYIIKSDSTKRLAASATTACNGKDLSPLTPPMLQPSTNLAH